MIGTKITHELIKFAKIFHVMKKVIHRGGLLAVVIGIVYLWFGLLKLFPGVSPEEGLARRSIDFLFGGVVSHPSGILILAIIEGLIGLALLTGTLQRIAIWVAIGHMVFTFTPLINEAATVWDRIPFGLTLTGQYLFKNLIILAALISLLPRKRR
jgi:uncharacterized membrane protein YphA (DoxX/SURF4 family)